MSSCFLTFLCFSNIISNSVLWCWSTGNILELFSSAVMHLSLQSFLQIYSMKRLTKVTFPVYLFSLQNSLLPAVDIDVFVLFSAGFWLFVWDFLNPFLILFFSVFHSHSPLVHYFPPWINISVPFASDCSVSTVFLFQIF